MTRMRTRIVNLAVAGVLAGALLARAQGEAAEPLVLEGKFFCPLERLVTMPFPGEITEVKVASGERVIQGDDLVAYRLEPEARAALLRRVARPHLADLEIQMADAEKNLQSLRKSFDEARRLAEQGMAATQHLEQVEGEMRLARLRRDTLRRRYNVEQELVKQDQELLTALLGREVGPESVPEEISLPAPVSGTVLWIGQDVREKAELGEGDKVLLIGTTDPMALRARVYEKEAARLSEGDEGRVTLDSLPGRTFEARASRISWAPIEPGLESPSFYEVEFAVPNPDQAIRPGFKGRVSLSGSRQQ